MTNRASSHPESERPTRTPSSLSQGTNRPARERKREREKRERKGGETLGPESTMTSAVNELGPAYHRDRARRPRHARTRDTTKDSEQGEENPWPTALRLIANNEQETRAPGSPLRGAGQPSSHFDHHATSLALSRREHGLGVRIFRCGSHLELSSWASPRSKGSSRI